ncbi:MAG: DEAD/DEAH box helicase [Thermus sp.]|nr:DEAD/DEAH box helicase [Thermus sp.]
MSGGNLLDVHAKTLQDYRSFVESFVRIADDRLRRFVLERLRGGEFWPEPFLGLSPGYELAGSVDKLAEKGLIHPTTAQIFRRPDGSPFHLFRHQVEAIHCAQEGKSFVLTSGTGSGKSFAYFIPIADAVVRNPGLAGPLALVVYPMNALVNSQLKALEELKARYEARHGRPFPLRFARYTGETPEDLRRRIREERPHLILTNYVMLEYLMVRPEDRSLISPPPASAPFFLVFDELHTYRGRRGADVALLVRRIRSRLPEGRKVVHIGTSATMVAGKGASRDERRRVVAHFATRFFGHPIGPEEVVEETLKPVTIGRPPSLQELKQSLSIPLPTELEAFRQHPLARFLEWELGLEEEAPGSYRRKPPRTLGEAATVLGQKAGISAEEAYGYLRDILLKAASLKDAGGRPLFAPRLHQFISQTRSVYATLEDPHSRQFRMEPSQSSPPFFPLRFCRNCGQEHYLVIRDRDRFRPHPETGEPLDQEGYLTYWPNKKLDLPAEWYDGREKLKNTWKDRVPELIWVDREGNLSSEGSPGALPFLWQGFPFTICPSCGTYYDRRVGEFRKLTYLGSEGRTSAATVLGLSLLRHAKATLGEGRDKLLSFTDNRQDASLQAGHFNDFVTTVLMRTALRKALERYGTLYHPDHPNVAEKIREAMGLSLGHYAKNPSVHAASTAAAKVQKVLEEVILFRLYEDLRREWRYTQPNLEDVGLLKVQYRDLESPGFLNHLLRNFPGLGGDVQGALAVVQEFLDVLRKELAIDAPLLQENFTRFRQRTNEHLDELWALDEDDQPLYPATLVLGENGTQGKGDWQEKGRVIKLSPRSRLGKLLAKLGLGPESYAPFLKVLEAYDLLRPVAGGYRIPESALLWSLGNPKTDANPFFLELYTLDPQDLLGLEGREHTAQVVAPGERERRERRFRYAKEDLEVEPNLKRLPFLVATPTLELGVDIADLDMVHLRNIPPTPANYAQRSGRAGRQGQMGLIVAFAGGYSHHDQYFFRHRQEMVAGEVKAPSLDLANEALLRAHIQAEWLVSTGLALRDNITFTVNTEDDRLPLHDDVEKALHLAPEVQESLRQRLKRILEADWAELEEQGFSWSWVDEVLAEAPKEFDRAFDRWRNLYRAVQKDKEAALQDLRRLRGKEREAAEKRFKEASRQQDLLENSSASKEEGDFYPYRYLATEGFLPGYGFPTLPVSAWVPRGDGEFLQRPRHLALREMAPGNLIYHEGRKWFPKRFLAVPGGLEERVQTRRLCPVCGSLADKDHGVCPQCGSSLEGVAPIVAMEFTNVALGPRARITANEEERLRLGYTITLAYDLSGVPKDRLRWAEGESGGRSFRLLYAPSAQIYLFNRGPKKREVDGFYIDLQSGEFISQEKAEEPADSPRRVGRYNLFVRLTQNVLFLYVSDLLRGVSQREVVEHSLAYALKRGLEAFFQVEESELGVELVGSGDHRAILFLEEAEGGLGILRRLTEDPTLLAQVAQAALKVLHFEGQGATVDTKPECTDACYECLLSYGNQTVAHLLNRHQVRELLLELSHSSVTTQEVISEDAQLQKLLAACESELERRFLLFLHERGLRLPDEAQYRIQEAHTVADFLYRPNIAVYVDGPHHDAPEQKRIDEHQRAALWDLGYVVLVARYDDDWEELVRQEPWRDVVGSGNKPVATQPDPRWNEVFHLLDPRWHPVFKGLMALGAPPPDEGPEDLLEEGRVVGQSLARWGDLYLVPKGSWTPPGALEVEESMPAEKIWEVLSWRIGV